LRKEVTSMERRYLFVSYAREDAKAVIPLVDAVREEYRLRGLDVEIWMDVESLRPGQSWEAEITRALQDSIGFLVFVSPAAMKSTWVSREILAAADRPDRLIVPVILRHVPNLPDALAMRQWLDLSRTQRKPELVKAAHQIADATENYLRRGPISPPVSSTEAPETASTIARELRSPPAISGIGERPDSIFVVHGHDKDALGEIETFLTTVGVTPVVLTRIGGAAQSLLQKFFASAADARFAIVILSADDLGASRIQYESEGVADRALQFRARQNVVLELGFFYGLLGWENVFVVVRAPNRVFPNFERPSDLDGAVFDTMDPAGVWRESLRSKLREAGFRLT
jgi:predicted nucleotide-binding protein